MINLEQIKQDAFEDEMQKVALSQPTMRNAVKKALMSIHPSSDMMSSGRRLKQAVSINEGAVKRDLQKKLDYKPFFDRLKKIHKLDGIK